jgi:perosamine synthetase
VACYSLYANKLITTGEGGILVTNKKETYERALSYRNLAHSKERFVHSDLAYNFRMSNLQAALGLAQLEQMNKFIEIKQRNRDLYKKYLPEGVRVEFNVEIPWMYLVQTKYDAGKIVKSMEEKNISCRRYFYPLHRQPCFKGKYEYLSFPAADYFWEHYFYLPSGLTLTEKEIKYVCKSLKNTLAIIT